MTYQPSAHEADFVRGAVARDANSGANLSEPELTSDDQTRIAKRNLDPT